MYYLVCSCYLVLWPQDWKIKAYLLIYLLTDRVARWPLLTSEPDSERRGLWGGSGYPSTSQLWRGGSKIEVLCKIRDWYVMHFERNRSQIPATTRARETGRHYNDIRVWLVTACLSDWLLYIHNVCLLQQQSSCNKLYFANFTKSDGIAC